MDRLKFTKINTDVERQFLIGLIASDSFAKKIRPIFEYEYLDLSAAKTISKWCIEYHRKYNRAPQAVIQDIFNDKKKSLKEEDSKWIEEFLVSISKEYSKQGSNEEYLFSSCVKYFKRQKLLKATEKVQELLERNKDDQAQQVWLDSLSIPGSVDLGIDPFDAGTIKELLRKREEGISLTLGISSLDKMVGPMRGGWLVMFLGPEKRGKTWSMVHMAVRGMFKGYNVVYVSLEASDERDIDSAIRFWKAVGSLSSKEPVLSFPFFADGGKVEYMKVERPRLEQKNILEMAKTLNKAMNVRFRLKAYPMGAASIQDIKMYLDLLEVYENFSPHVIIVDYLGVIKAPSDIKETRERYNYNSMALKALAQERKAIVITGHQGTAAALEEKSMRPIHTSEDKRTLANVDVMYGLNQTDAEMDEGIMRINVLVHRHQKFTRMKQAKVLQQLDAGQFVLEDRIIDKPGTERFKRKREGDEK